MTPPPLAAAAQRLRGRPGRPRKAVSAAAERHLSGHSAGTAAPQTRMDSGARASAPASSASARGEFFGYSGGRSTRSNGSVNPPLKSLFPEGPRLLDVTAAGAYLGLSPWSIRDLVTAGRLRRVQLPLSGARQLRRLLFDRADLDRLIETSKESAP